MGREVRMVPPNWEHPKAEGKDCLQPMYHESYAIARSRWFKGLAKHDPNKHEGLDYWDYEGPPPERAYYVPFSKKSATWYQLWETVSEGTPVSPPFATQEELAQHLAKYGDDWDQSRGRGGWGIDRARAFVEAGGAPSMMICNGRILESKDVPLAMKEQKEAPPKGSE